jgi:pyrroline-5-carboxylate reductase
MHSPMKLGVIGCGKMGQALVNGVLNAGLCPPADLVVHDKYSAAVDHLVTSSGVTPGGSNQAVAKQADTIVLAVKPADLVPMLREVADSPHPALYISIAAGIRIKHLEQALDIPQRPHRVIRVMPNTPALVGKGASAFSLGTTATEDDASVAEHILSAVGIVERVPEELLDTVTALSGSGPAYIFAMIESMVAGAVELGLDEKIALDLAVQTVAGAAEMISQTGDSPATLREHVTSPNGTTFAALESMNQNGFNETIRQALIAAHDRSIELGQ